MKLLPTIKRILTWLCIYRDSEYTQKWENIVFSMTVYIGDICGAFSSIAYFLLFMSTNLENALFALMGFVAFYSQIYVIISVMTFRHKVCTIFKQLAKIYSASKCFIRSSVFEKLL